MPEWLLGFLGAADLFAFFNDDDDDTADRLRSPVILTHQATDWSAAVFHRSLPSRGKALVHFVDD